MKAGFQYFPESFMWSQGMMIVIEMARWGGSAMSEVDRVGQPAQGQGGRQRGLGREWEKEARRIEAMGDAAMKDNFVLSAAGHYLRAATYYFVGERFVAARSEENRALPELPALLQARHQAPLSEHRARRSAVCARGKRRHCRHGS